MPRVKVFLKSLPVIACPLMLSACPASTSEHAHRLDNAILWAATAVEYQAASAQTYAQATRDLPRLIADTSHSALIGHQGKSEKPPAVILDIDETVVSGVDMEQTLVPFTAERQYRWGLVHQSIPINGVAEFVSAARSQGVEVFFVTNRPCEVLGDVDGDCPQDQAVVDLVREVGIETDVDHVLLADEKPDWGKEKVVRREVIAMTHRVIMLFGDDYGDFVPCSRPYPVAPCTQAGTLVSRAESFETHREYWGNGWYILPNPMYGTWTSAD